MDIQNNIPQAIPVEQVSFKKSKVIKTLAVIQLVAFAGQVMFFVAAKFLPNFAMPEFMIIVVGWLAVLGGAVYGFGLIMTVASIFILSTKKQKSYKNASLILIIGLAWGVVLAVIGILAFSKPW